jgi:integrase
MGRSKSKHRHLPPRMRYAHGAWFHADARGGRKPWVLLGHTYAEAILRYGQLEAQSADRRDFNALAHKYVAEALPGLAPSTQAVRKTLLKNLRKVFGPVLPGDIRQIHAYRYMDERGKAVGRSEVSLLSSILTFGVRKGWIESNPLHGLKLATQKRRKRYLTDAELAAILAAASTEVAHAVSLMHFTALRVGDALGIRWRDWQADGLHVRVSKSKADLIFDRTPGLDSLMAEMRSRKVAGLYVLTDRQGRRWTYKRLYAEWQKVAPVDANLHDLRRKRLTDLARERGVEFAQKIAAHSDPRMTQSYVSDVARVAI